MLVHSTRDGTRSMDLFTGRYLNDLLAEFPHHNTLYGEFPEFLRYADHISFGHFCIDPEQQVGGGEMEEMKGVRLEELTVVHQPADLFCRRGNIIG